MLFFSSLYCFLLLLLLSAAASYTSSASCIVYSIYIYRFTHRASLVCTYHKTHIYICIHVHIHTYIYISIKSTDYLDFYIDIAPQNACTETSNRKHEHITIIVMHSPSTMLYRIHILFSIIYKRTAYYLTIIPRAIIVLNLGAML